VFSVEFSTKIEAFAIRRIILFCFWFLSFLCQCFPLESVLYPSRDHIQICGRQDFAFGAGNLW
jgi:hypothetical protein